MSRPLRSTPITGASPLLRAGPPADAGRYSTSPVSAVDALPLTHPARHQALRAGGIGTGLPTFRAGAADQARAAYMPDTTWPILGHPAHPGDSVLPPVSMPTKTFRHVNSGSLALAFPGPT